ncbi:MAG: outer membrane protein assembly factor BamD [Desulfuromonas sp.]|nr:MAG: outer membrane protein assembly factor BamD [Desulfuromonas sp.]
MYRNILIIFIAVAFIVGCSSDKNIRTNSPAYYFKEGERLFEKGLYPDAIAAWEKVRDSYYSPELNILAEMKIAEAYYQDEKYVEAAASYESFLKNHPNNQRAETVLYYLGMSYYKQVLPAGLDQTAANNSIITFRNLLKLYPDTPRADEVKGYIAFCRNRLAEHELTIGRFYVRTEEPDAAIGRLEAILTDFPEFEDRADLYYLLGQAYLQKDNKEKAVESFNHLYTQYPDSKLIPKAKKSLEKYF